MSTLIAGNVDVVINDATVAVPGQVKDLLLEEWLSTVAHLEGNRHGKGAITPPPLEKLAGYYEHLAELAKGYEKDAAKRTVSDLSIRTVKTLPVAGESFFCRNYDKACHKQTHALS